MFGKKEMSEEDKRSEKIMKERTGVQSLKCPHCEGTIDYEENCPKVLNLEFTVYGAMVGCPHCDKVLGVTVEF